MLHDFYGRNTLAYMTDMFGAIIVGGAVFFAVLTKSFGWLSNPELMAFSITSAFLTASLLQVGVWTVTEMVNAFTAVQRIKEYKDEKSLLEAPFDKPVPPRGWPDNGKVVAKDIWYRYRPDLDYVIRGVSFSSERNSRSTSEWGAISARP